MAHIPNRIMFSDKLNKKVTTQDLLALCKPGKTLHQVKMFYQVRDISNDIQPKKKLVSTRLMCTAKACIEIGLDPEKVLGELIKIKD